MMAITVSRFKTVMALCWPWLRVDGHKSRRIVARHLSDGGTDLCYMDNPSNGFESCGGGVVRITVFSRVN